MKPWIQTLAIYAAVGLIIAVLALLPPTEEPNQNWIEGGMSIPQATPVIAVWQARDGRLVSSPVERIGDGFYEYGPRGTEVSLFNGPPNWWLPIPGGNP